MCTRKRGFNSRWSSDPEQPCDAPQQRCKRGRRSGDELRDRERPPASLDIAFSQVQEVTLDLFFAGSPKVLGVEDDVFERVRAEDARMRSENVGVLERERVERAAELFVRKDEGCVDTSLGPTSHQTGAPLEIVLREARDEHERGQRCLSRLVKHLPVHNHGEQSSGEDPLKVVDEGDCRTFPRCTHRFIVGPGALRAASIGGTRVPRRKFPQGTIATACSCGS